MICDPCKVQHHDDCAGDTQCDCQHRVDERPEDARAGESIEG